ncbi:MAG: hypothetical protein E6G30_08055 [Actinobacteria bacterium]|jgi:hypothetical protein|nr:MAG: hypothetical protein E6G30_08055 [Actinomycetota bacterium]
MAPWCWLASFSPDDFPHPDFGASPTPFVLLLVGGMAVAIVGHIYRSKTLIALGIGAAFLGTFLLPVFIFIGRS